MIVFAALLIVIGAVILLTTNWDDVPGILTSLSLIGIGFALGAFR